MPASAPPIFRAAGASGWDRESCDGAHLDTLWQSTLEDLGRTSGHESTPDTGLWEEVHPQGTSGP